MLNYANAIHKDSGKLIEVANDIYATPFWNEDFCEGLVQYLEYNKNLYKISDDGYKIAQLSMSYLSKVLTIQMLEHHYKSCILGAAKYFLEENFEGYMDPVFLRYSAEENSTNKLALHNDVSRLSTLVKLNDGYEGGETVFPRQKYSSVELPVGYVLLWPGMVTHPHEVKPITAGIKHALTIWTYPPAWNAPTGINRNEIVKD